MNLRHRNGQSLLEPTGGRIVVSLDGVPVDSRWGESIITVDPGEHTIAVHVRWLGMRWGSSVTRVDVSANKSQTVDYMTPSFIWQKGRLSVRS
jgi:hypothetical protein